MKPKRVLIYLLLVVSVLFLITLFFKGGSSLKIEESYESKPQKEVFTSTQLKFSPKPIPPEFRERIESKASKNHNENIIKK